jgi:hypothetical protein
MKKIKHSAFSVIILLTGIFISNCTLKNNSNSMAHFNPDTFEPDTTYQTLFQWEAVKPCLKDTLESNNFKGHTSCPKCGVKSEKLIWIKYSSPESSWEKLCGREGPLSICPACKIQVEFIIELMN